MKKLLTLILFSGMAVGASAQLVNQGGSIVIEQGATLVVESDITNNGTGTINNSGTIEVKGNLTSVATATFTSSSASKLKFTGDSPSAVDLKAGTMLNDVEMAKTAEDVTLASDLDINGDLTFTEDDNQIILGANSIALSPTSAADNSLVTNSFIVTNGAGVVTKEGLSTAFEFPVGAATDSQNDITLTEAGTADDISVRVLANAYDAPATQTDVMTEDVVNATWEITEATTGGSDLTAAPSWIAADETATFDNTDAAVYQFNGTDYTALAATGAATTASGITTVSNPGLVLDGTDYVIAGDGGLSAALLAIKMFLQGPYVAANSLMSDDLRTGSHLPTAEPYGAMSTFTHVGDGGAEAVSSSSDFDFATDGDDVVDWVFVEIRDNSNTTISTRSALLQRDGDVVDLDGGNVKFSAIPNGDYDIFVRHRHQLGIKSANNVTLSKGAVATYDFTTAAGQAQGADVSEVESGVFGAYSGDANSDGQVNASDIEVIWKPQNGQPFIYTTSTADSNMDGTTNASDFELHIKVNNSKTSQIDN